MSMIFLNNEKEANPKLVRFVIMLSKLQCQEALKMLSDFNRESYYDHLQKLLQIIGDEAVLRLDLFKLRQMNMHLKYEITHLNHRLAQEILRQRPDNMTEYQKQIIQLFTYLQRNELITGQKRADVFKLDRLSVVFQELKEYKLLKDHISHDNKKEDHLRFQSKQGEQLRMLVVDNTSKYNETIAFLKQQFPKIIGDLQICEVPVNIFGEGFKKIYYKFIEQLRKMKNSYQDLNRPIKEKIMVFSRRQGIQIDQSAESTKCLQELLLKLDKILERPQPQRSSFRRSISRISIQSITSNTSFISNSSNNQSYKLKRSKNMFVNQYQPQVNEIHKIISKYVQEIPKYTQLGLLDKLRQLVKKVKQFTSEFQQLKKNDDKFINSFMLANKKIKEISKDDNSLQKQDKLPVLKNKESNDYITIQNTDILRIKKQLEQQKSKRIKVEQSNARLLVKVKEYSLKKNASFIEQTVNYAQIQCETSLVSFKEEIIGLKETINQLKQQLEEKTMKITSLEISRKEDRLKFEKQKQKLLDAQRVKYNRLRDDYDSVIDELSTLGRLYDDIIQQQTPNNYQALKLKDELQLLRAENEEMRQQMMMNNKKQVGISRRIFNTQTNQSSGNNESLASKLGLESKALKQLKELKDKVATLQLQNRQLINQTNKIEYYKTLLEKQTRECSQLKQQVSILTRDNQKLTKDLKMVEIHKVTHNEKNLPYLHLFPPGFIFEDADYQERLFLLEHLQSYTGTIRKTQLIYRADPHNRTNFHKYVDKQRHIVAIFKTIYGRLIAAYSQEAFDAGGIIRGHGIIFSLWGRIVFELKQKRAISYDDYFLIFGNSELRIKTGEFHLFSNFGIASSYYNNRGEKVNALLGEDNEREVDLSHFQVYALDLEY